MSQKIHENIARAFAAESKGAAQLAAFALKAEREGYTRLAQLFRVMENAKAVHARRFYLLLRGKIGMTRDNVKTALQNEINAINDLYPNMVEEARDASSAIKKAFHQSMETDGESAKQYEKAMGERLSGEEIVYYVCQICGHVHENEVPENCPICHAVPGRFRRVD